MQAKRWVDFLLRNGLLLLGLGGGAVGRTLHLGAAACGHGVAIREDVLGALPGLDADDVHGIDLLEGAVFALDDGKVHQAGGEKETAGEDVAHAEVDGAGDEGSEEGQQEVPQPVGRGGQRHAARAILGRIQLGDDGPHHGAPGRGEAEDEQAGEDDHGGAGGLGVLGVTPVEGEVADRGEHHEAYEHPQGAANEGLAAAKVLDHVQAQEGGAEVDAAQDHLRHVAVLDPGALKDGGAVVEEVVGAGQLLEGLQDDTDHETILHARGAQHHEPGDPAARHFLFVFLLNLVKLQLQGPVVLRDAVDLGERRDGLVDFSVSVVPTGTLGEEGHAPAEDDGPEVRDAHGDAPGAGVGAGLGAEIDAVGDEDAQRDEELVGADQRSANVSGAGLALVHGHQQTQRADPETSDPTTHGDLVPFADGGGDLDGDADADHDTPPGDRPFPSHAVCNGSGNQRAHERSNGQLRYRLLDTPFSSNKKKEMTPTNATIRPDLTFVK
jgi:hypothetical protein